MRSHIIVVDDTDSMRMLAVRHLEREGYRVIALGSATEVLDFVRTEVPDLIVSDIMMPEMSGYDLLERLRADPRLTAVPVIFVSALTDAPNIERGQKLGVDHYLVKPYTSKQLLAVVGGTLRRYAELRNAKVVRPTIESTGNVPAAGFSPTGIRPIDDQVGGLCQGRVYLALGSVGSGKSVLAVEFLYRGLERGEGAVLVTTDRLDAALYVGTSMRFDLRPYVRSGQLIVLGLHERFEYALETREDLLALAAEIEAAARECNASRVVVASILTVVCSAPRLALSAPILSELIGGLERVGATTLLVSDEPATPQEELAEAYLKRTTFGTIALAKSPEGRGLSVLRLDRMAGVSTEPAGRHFRIVPGSGLAIVDASAPDVEDELESLRRFLEVELAGASAEGGLTATPKGGWRLRDPFAQHLRECVTAALRVCDRPALVVGRFAFANGVETKTPVGPTAAELRTLVGEHELLCWAQPTEVAVLALDPDRSRLDALRTRLRGGLDALARARGLSLAEDRLATVALPENGTTTDALLTALGQELEGHGESARTAHAVA
jgi:CheY-like chemotaxis protein